mgnify:CR=1 FL=1
MSMEEKQNFQTFQGFSSQILKPSNQEQICQIVRECYKKNIPLEILGLGTKKKIGRNFQSEKTLDLSNYSGIIDYKPEELMQIFNKKILDAKWSADKDALQKEWFEKNADYFKYYGRDMETLFAKVKISHSRRVFCLPEDKKTTITLKDMDSGLALYLANWLCLSLLTNNHPSFHNYYLEPQNLQKMRDYIFYH